MNILLAAHNILDPGGIVNHTHHLRLGLQEIGHTGTVALFTNSNDKITPFQNITVDQRKLPKDFVVGYKSNTDNAISFIKQFDYVIWEVPVPTKMAANKGNNLWPQLYDHEIPQVGIIHDAHVVDRTPWIHHILDKFSALLPVQTCGLTSCKDLSIESTLIVNPFDLSEGDQLEWNFRENMFVSACNFKAMKHMDDLIRAIPYIPSNIRKIIGGGGIEQCYMTSKDKCKDKYIVNSRKIWDIALEYGMEYTGFLQTKDRTSFYNKAKIVVDPSYIQSYCDKGGSLTRVFIEAAICGAIPVARKEFVDPNFFKPFVNYVPISIHSTEKEIAYAITETIYSDRNHKIPENNYSILEQFDRKTVAKQFMLRNRTRENTIQGKTSNKVIAESNLNLASFFGIKKTGGLGRWF